MGAMSSGSSERYFQKKQKDKSKFVKGVKVAYYIKVSFK